MSSLNALHTAANLVHAWLPATPQINWPLLSQRAGADVWVKHENHLPTGAFKVRGGVVFASRQPAGRGLISATRGNHGQSLAWAGSRFGLPVTIVVPRGNSTGRKPNVTPGPRAWRSFHRLPPTLSRMSRPTRWNRSRRWPTWTWSMCRTATSQLPSGRIGQTRII